MLAVSNTSPISNLASIGRLALLSRQFASVWIPDAVVRELALHPDPNAKAEIRAALDAGWLQAHSTGQSNLLHLLRSQLHAGEAEAIALAVDSKADRVLIDEKEGRRIASRSGLMVTGVLGILLAAKLNHEISTLRVEIENLRRQARFYVDPALIEKILIAGGE